MSSLGAAHPAPHVPVLVAPILEHLTPILGPNSCLLDATVGAGGHAEALLAHMPESSRYIGIDRDPAILAYTQERLAPYPNVVLEHGCFSDIADYQSRHAPAGFTAILADIGVSSLQLDDESRGFSFRASAPLDMRMDPEDETTAADLIARWCERDLADLIFQYGGERRSRRIASAIVAARRKHPITNTTQLADIIREAVGRGYERGRIHPATRTFQALRIAVNRELEELDALLDQAPTALAPGGRIAVISFHSLEDRRVKLAFRELGKSGTLEVRTKKPIRAQDDEIASNRRARSARLRVAEKR